MKTPQELKLEQLKQKLRLAADKFKACEILEPGEYRFEILEVSLEHDDKRGYDYVFVRLDCDGTTTSDRFPITDQMLWKLKALVSEMGLDSDSFEPQQLIGCVGKLTAKKQKDMVLYRYQAAV